MRGKSFLTVVVVTLCSVVVSAYQDLESNLISIEKKASDIREMLVDRSAYKTIEVEDLRGLECRTYGKTKGVLSLDERGQKVYTDDSGLRITDIKDYYYPSQVSIYSLPLQESMNKDMLVSMVQQGTNPFNLRLCVLAMVKVGYRYVGELACDTSRQAKGIIEASVHSDRLEADSYIECSAPSKMI